MQGWENVVKYRDENNLKTEICPKCNERSFVVTDDNFICWACDYQNEQPFVRKYDVEDLNLKIDSVEFFGESKYTDGGMTIYWSGNRGFGTLTIVDNKNILEADTEYMDVQQDKSFIKKILSLLAEKIVITS